MDAKTGAGSTSDSISAHKHAYEQVFSTFSNSQPRFIQSQLRQEAAPSKDENENGNDAGNQSQQKKNGAQSPLFWVNSDPQTVRRGSKEETLKRIRSHVMSEHNRKKRLENTRRYNKSKGWKNLAFRPEPAPTSKLSHALTASISAASVSSSSSSSSSPPSDRSSSKGSSSPEEKGYSLKKSVAKPVNRDWRPSNTSSSDITITQHRQLDRLPAKVPPLQVGTADADPFLAAQVQLSETQYQHLKFFLYDLIPQAAPFLHHGIPKLRSHWVALAQSNPSALHACITSAATNKALMTGAFFADPDTQRSSPLILDRLRSRGETISWINRHLSLTSSASSDAVIAAVSILISIEITGSNAQDIAIHLNGLRKMVSLRMNFSDIATNVRWQIEWTDIRAACKAMSKPIFPFIRYTMPAHIPREVRVSNAGKLASSLHSLNRTIPGIFSIDLLRTINNVTSATLYAEIHKLQPKRAAIIFDEQIEEYFNNEVLYTEYCLLSHRFTPDGTRLLGDDNPEGATRLAMLIFHNTALWPFYPSVAPIFPMPVILLQTALRSSIAAGHYDSAATRPLLVWLLFVGACAAKYLPPCRAFFIDELALAVRHRCFAASPALSTTSTATITAATTTLPAPPRSSPSSASSISSMPTSPTSPSSLHAFDAFHDLLQGYLYVERCYLAEAREIHALLFGYDR